MNTLKAKLLVAVGAGILLVVSAVALTKSNRTNPTLPKDQQETKQTIDTLPLVVSNVKKIEVTKATLKNPGTNKAVAVLELKNKSNKAVVAVSVEIRDPDEADGITMNGFNGEDELPSTVIEPHGFITVELPLNNATPGEPIRVSGIVYADKSEDGEKTALETIHSQREHSKANKLRIDASPKAREKGSPSPQ